MVAFTDRHNGPEARETREMLKELGMPSIETLISKTIPGAIRLGRELEIPDGASEHAALVELRGKFSRQPTAKALIGQVPVFGICLGHQILGQAFGGKTYKLKFGHRGANHPVKDLRTGVIEITTQNHGFAVSDDAVPGAEITHVNLNDGTVEGVAAPDRHAFSVQYHPESTPGPHDSRYLFGRFREEIDRFKRGGEA